VIRVVDIGVTGELECAVGGDVILSDCKTRLGLPMRILLRTIQVPARLVEVIPGGADEEAERQVVADAQQRQVVWRG
jgi:hypothetical protein